MKKVLLIGIFVFSLFICSCGEENKKDCHHYTGSDYWDDPLYNCNGVHRNTDRRAETPQRLDERSESSSVPLDE
ncbi:MAG: hypothetical protein A2Y10_11050 [Planctomycetes bacterium GWF2_41_51]|nr:MAG: hypothetical protein A2Y10_11050 [Planctomycetes bacterium GWF2_41_51]HBG28414.1 hypothetical protein [Phycisphaerales bacterium]